MEVTTKIKLKPYLREFLIAKFGEEPIRFPGNSDLLALIHVLRIKPPKRDIVQDDVNTEIVIPYQRLGRDPRTYNYLGKRAQMEFQKRVHTLFCITLNDYVAHKVHVEQFEWQAAIELFAEEYHIESITTDGLKQKNYRDRNGKRFKRENRFKHLN